MQEMNIGILQIYKRHVIKEVINMNKEYLVKQIKSMSNTFWGVKMSQLDIDRLMNEFELTVDLYQSILREEDYKLNSKEQSLLKNVTGI
jgi:hypothetical protein